MVNSSLHFRILNIFLYNNKRYLYYILFIFVLSSLVCDYQINAIDETNTNDIFPISLSEKFNQHNDSRIINYPNSNITNLTNNNEDSIYGQIEAFENYVYVVWQESVTKSLPEHNYDIFFIKSEDKGKTFSKAINISNNSKNSYNQEISASDENVYVVWRESDQNIDDGNDSIMFKSSIDSGNTFNNSIELINNTNDAFPKIKSYRNYVYIVSNNENKKNSGLFFVKSSDKGNNFDEIIKLSDTSKSGESQIAVNQNEVLVVWGGFLLKNISNIYYVKSNDNGSPFTDSKTIFEKTIDSNNAKEYNKFEEFINNPLNVEVTNNNLSYLVWQDTTIPSQNQDILLLLNNQTNTNNTKLFNLSNNRSISECPSIAISNNNIYVIWEDFILGNHEILFANIPVENIDHRKALIKKF